VGVSLLSTLQSMKVMALNPLYQGIMLCSTHEPGDSMGAKLWGGSSICQASNYEDSGFRTNTSSSQGEKGFKTS
jgi:hypothetical protein